MPADTPQSKPQTVWNDPQHQGLTEQIYKRGLELLEEKKHAENLLYNISEAVISVTRDTKINIINKTAEELLQIDNQSVEGKDLNALLKLYSETGPVEPNEYCFKDHEVMMENLFYESAYGRKYLKLQSTNITNPQGLEECIITLTDITKERLLEKTKDDFISTTSHELRTPMTIIKSYIWMLENSKNGTLTEKQREYLSKAKNGVERMLNMINDTLNVSKIDQNALQLRIEKIDINKFLEDTAQDFLIKAREKNLDFKMQVEDGCNFVYADRGKLQEILINLLGNSVKFTSAGYIKLVVSTIDNSAVKFEVFDTGKGIDRGDISRLFHKFGRIDNSYQTTAESGGTGLGLYIVKNLVEAMGGTVGVSSKGLHKGSIFWFTLPRQYDKVPKHLQKTSILSLAPALETHITSICPL